jgi:hypothetical protein
VLLAWLSLASAGSSGSLDRLTSSR